MSKTGLPRHSQQSLVLRQLLRSEICTERVICVLDAFELLLGGALAGADVPVRMPLARGLQIRLANSRRLQSRGGRQAQHIEMASKYLICTSSR